MLVSAANTQPADIKEPEGFKKKAHTHGIHKKCGEREKGGWMGFDEPTTTDDADGGDS